MTEAIKLGIKSVLEQRKEYDALNYINELEKENAELKAKLNGALDICNIPEFRISDLEKENEQLKKKLCLMRKYIYGNYDLEYKEMQLQHIDEFGLELNKRW